MATNSDDSSGLTLSLGLSASPANSTPGMALPASVPLALKDQLDQAATDSVTGTGADESHVLDDDASDVKSVTDSVLDRREQQRQFTLRKAMEKQQALQREQLEDENRVALAKIQQQQAERQAEVARQQAELDKAAAQEKALVEQQKAQHALCLRELEIQCAQAEIQLAKMEVDAEISRSERSRASRRRRNDKIPSRFPCW